MCMMCRVGDTLQMACGRRTCLRMTSADGQTTRVRRADDVRVSPGVVLHEIRQLRQVFAWVSAINLTSKYRRSGESDKRKPYWRCQKRGNKNKNKKYQIFSEI